MIWVLKLGELEELFLYGELEELYVEVWGSVLQVRPRNACPCGEVWRMARGMWGVVWCVVWGCVVRW
jgi:hypothetical protein